MDSLACLLVASLFLEVHSAPAIRKDGGKDNKLPAPSGPSMSHIKPVGAAIAKNFVALTELPPPKLPPIHYHNGRRHMDDDCSPRPIEEVVEGGQVAIFGDYYEEKFAKTIATVVFPDHIDRKHFEVTTQVPYFTVGFVEAIGFHASTVKSEHPDECEKIYQDHIAEQYSDETRDMSEESLEMARMPLAHIGTFDTVAEVDKNNALYADLEMPI